MHAPDVLLISRSEIRRLLDPDACIRAVEDAFAVVADVRGTSAPPAVLGSHVPDGGFHVKTAGLSGDRAFYVAKINANFPDNPRRSGLPTVQGVLALFDARCGVLLALMDSSEVTSLRTAAVSAVAARHLSRADASTVTIIGCGVQGRSHLRALMRVRAISSVYAHDSNAESARSFAQDMSRELRIAITVVGDFHAVLAHTDICVTCTPSRAPLLSSDDLCEGMFVAAVGADNEEKQELAPGLMARSRVVVDSREQCAAMGDLHHAILAGVMTPDDVHADLSEVVAGRKPGRTSPSDIIVFDSTGTALADVAAAVALYDRALADGTARTFGLAS